MIFPVPVFPVSFAAGVSGSSKPGWEYLADREGFLDEDLPWDVTGHGADYEGGERGSMRSTESLESEKKVRENGIKDEVRSVQG